MAILGTYPDDSATTASDKYLTYDSSGATKLTPASTLLAYILPGGGVTTDKQTATTFSGNMTSLAVITTSFTNQASVTLPTVPVAHKYLINAVFVLNHEGANNVRDYNVAVRNGTTTLQSATWSAAATQYLNSIPVTNVFTSSSTGGQTINFSVSRSIDNAGSLNAFSHYTIIDLGRA